MVIKTERKTKLTEESMALELVQWFGDFNPVLMKKVEKVVIDYYLKGENK